MLPLDRFSVPGHERVVRSPWVCRRAAWWFDKPVLSEAEGLTTNGWEPAFLGVF